MGMVHTKYYNLPFLLPWDLCVFDYSIKRTNALKPICCVILSQQNEIAWRDCVKVAHVCFVIRKQQLMALIFGRNHKAFDVADYVQIGQKEPGSATLYVTMKNREGVGDMAKLFDLTNVDMNFEFKVVERPVRTGMGKLKLRVGSL